MLSQPTTKFIQRTAEPNAAKRAAELIGEVQIERLRETVADGKRQGKSFSLDRQIEPLVMKSEVARAERDHQLQLRLVRHTMVDGDAALPPSQAVADPAAVAIPLQHRFAETA